ncbi:phosphotransferase [Hazenella sp. IB182353]|uniref:phosphotransferase n=1 Tax=Polycladospora coralii TaxID=2771432 RepID=UPI001746021D|nr:phosphotransferase [Polycladospora coralii]MBS7529819.1 phosphotransferase [Polycladospora coralii]
MTSLNRKIGAWTGEKRLPELLSVQYGLKLQEVEPVEGVLKLYTNEGIYVLKRVPKEMTEYLYLLIELAEHTPFVTVPIHTIRNKPYFDGFCHRYCLLSWTDTYSPRSFQHVTDWIAATEAIADLHAQTRNFKEKKNYKLIQKDHTWKIEWEKDYKQIEIFNVAARYTPNPTPLDHHWLKAAAYTTGLVESIIQHYEKLNGDEAWQNSYALGKVCHGNLHRKNILFDQQNQIKFIDWNQVRLDSRMYDLTKWIWYAYGKTGSLPMMKQILQRYHQNVPIQESEFTLMYLRSLYPEQLIHTLKLAYHEGSDNSKDWGSKMKQIMEQEKQKVDVLKQLMPQIEENFVVQIPLVTWIHQ